ncbi:MAG: enoyl-CoA hydratase/isomerase family protein [Chitinophagaceae bacterium]
MYHTLLIEKQQRICYVTINRPEKLNALNKTVIDELSHVVDDVITDVNIGGAIITGSGPKSFVAGADITEFLSMDANAGTQLAAVGQDKLFNKIERSPKPFLAAVNGFALGGGCELAMACHLRIAADNARFGQPEVNLGLIPGYGGTQRLTQLLGKGKALELMMSANMIDAQEAHRLGLVNEVVPPDQLIQKSNELMLTILSKGPNAVAKVIAAVNAYFEDGRDGYTEEIKLFGECFGTDEMKEGVTAFLEKRKPAF